MTDFIWWAREQCPPGSEKKKSCVVESVPDLLYYVSNWYNIYDRVTVGISLFTQC